MFRMRRCSPTFLKLTTICDVSHVISSTRPSSPLFFPTREEGLGTRLLHSDLNIMQSNDKSIEDTFPAGTFRNLFWKEQLKCAMVKDARQMQWHPTMIKINGV